MRLFSILTLTSLLAAGCANYASYPVLEGKQRADGPISAPVPEVVATAIEWCVAREDFRQQQSPSFSSSLLAWMNPRMKPLQSSSGDRISTRAHRLRMGS